MGILGDLGHARSRVGTGWGFATALVGMLCMMAPVMSTLGVNAMISIALVAGGMTMTIYAFKAGSIGPGMLQFMFGGLTILAGVAMFAQPQIGMYTITALLTAWFLVDGAYALYMGIKNKGTEGWGWMTVSGIASLVLGILLMQNFQESAMYFVGMLVGIRLIFSGWAMAMVGMAADAAVDVGEAVVEEAVESAVEDAVAGAAVREAAAEGFVAGAAVGAAAEAAAEDEERKE